MANVETLSELRPVLWAIVGFFFGLIGPIIVDRNRRQFEKREFWEAVQVELRELRYRFSLVALLQRLESSTIDHAYLTRIRPIFADYEGPNVADRMLKPMIDC